VFFFRIFPPGLFWANLDGMKQVSTKVKQMRRSRSGDQGAAGMVRAFRFDARSASLPSSPEGNCGRMLAKSADGGS
jgi:hypothetical protein